MIVPGRRVSLEIKDTTSKIIGAPIRFEVGLADYEARCRLDWEEYEVADISLNLHEIVTSAIAHYCRLLCDHGVVENKDLPATFRRPK